MGAWHCWSLAPWGGAFEASQGVWCPGGGVTGVGHHLSVPRFYSLPGLSSQPSGDHLLLLFQFQIIYLEIV